MRDTTETAPVEGGTESLSEGEGRDPRRGQNRPRRAPASGDRPNNPAGRRTAVLDTAHLGDIEGAFGRINVTDTEHPRTLKTRLLTLLAIVGPGSS